MIQTSFDPLDPKYRCFFGAVHVKTATYFLSYINLTLVILFTIASISERIVFQPLFVAFIVALICGGAIYGAATEKAGWLVPYLISTGLSVAFGFVIIVSGLITLMFAPGEIVPALTGKRYYVNEQRNLDEVKHDGDCAVMLIFFLYTIKLAVCIWMYLVVYRCYQFFVAKKEASRLPTYQTSFGNPTFSNANAHETKSSLQEIDL
uniref:Uncharacterized protein n=1 Tax=Panagrolaimus superbus TaxID=310955 RepID=A0A914YJH6_9BILA